MKSEDVGIPIKFLFLSVWVFFIFRLTSYININSTFLQFKFENSIKFYQDSLSVLILIGLLVYFLFKVTKNKKFHISIILIIYPICGVIGYFTNGYKNQYQDFILWHHFITLSSIFLFFAAIQSNKFFDYKFKELLLKIILIFIFVFYLVNILPDIAVKLFNYLTMQSSYISEITLFGITIDTKQNVNGSSRMILILMLVSLLLFKKFILSKTNLAILFFFISTILFTQIFLLQSRYNILASFIIIIFLLFGIKNINLKKKLIYFLVIIITPILIFNLNIIETNNRFSLHLNTLNTNNTLITKTLNTKKHSQIFFADLECETKIFTSKFEIFINTSSGKELKSSLQPLCLNGNFTTFEQYLIFLKAMEKNLKVIKKKYSDYKNLNHPLSTLLPDYIIKLESFKRHYGYSKLNVCSPKLRYIDLLSSGRVCGWEMLLYNIKKKDLFFGRGFFADQVYLEPSEKLSSNSWINILYNTGIVSFVLCIVFFILSLKFLKLKNFNHKNYFISISHYLFLYFIFRSMLEDTLAFASVDFLLSWICFIIIKDNYEKNSLDG